jgi:lipopolysaccharide assembly outer membrane protein LptD (OstA)
MHTWRFMALLFLGCAAFGNAAEEPPGWIIESPDAVEYDLSTGIATVTNGVVVRHGDIVLTAQRAIVNQVSGEVQAEGDVRISGQDILWSGQRLRYNLNTRRFIGEDTRTGQPPLFMKGDVVVGDQSNNVYVAANALLTTDDYAQPGYSIRAKTMVIVPGEYIEAKHATLRFGDVPVFYFPHYRRDLKKHGNFWIIAPGYRSQYGAFLVTSYNWFWNERLDGAININGYTERGVGVGPDLRWHLPRLGEGTVRYWYIHDFDPGSDPSGNPIPSDRDRVYFSHQGTLRSNLTIKSVVAYQSDAQIVRDFFETEYRQNIQPRTFVEVNQAWPNFGLNLLVQPRVNDFWETVERLPDVKLSGLRQQIGRTPLYYESDSSVGYFEHKFPDSPTNEPFAAFRFDTFHQVVLPRTFFGWLNVTPRVGGRYTHYGEASGPGATTSEEDRGVFNTGAEVSFRASRLWIGPHSKFWQVDGLRHIIEPSVNYAYVPNPNVPPARLPQFDSQLPTTRLLPIEFPDYNSIDSIDSQNVLRLGLANKLQTKRRGNVDNVVYWALVTDWRLDPNPGQTTFSDLYSDLDLKPFSWLTLSSGLRFDLSTHQWNETDNSITIVPHDVWSLTVGHRYLREVENEGPSSGYDIYYGTIYYRFNQNWAGRAFVLRQESDGTYLEQQYTLYRDFRSWTSAVSFRIRNEPTGPTDYTVAVTFSLKALPRFKLGEDSSKPTLLLGG